LKTTSTIASRSLQKIAPSMEERIASLERALEESQARLDFEIRERKQVTEDLNEKNIHLSTLLEQMPAMLWTVDRDLTITTSLGSGLAGIGVRPNELVGKRLQDYRKTESESDPSIIEHREALSGKSFTYENVVMDRTLAVNLRPLREPDGNISGVIGVALDITKLKETEKRLAAHGKILELISSENDQSLVFKEAISFVEKLFGEVRASVLLLDGTGKHLIHGAAPNLPQELNSIIEGLAIGPRVASCGTAAFLGQPVIVEDTEKDPLWADYRQIAEKFELRSCWSHPILSSCGKVLGTLATYSKTTRAPTVQESSDLRSLAHLLSLSIERKKNQEDLATTIHFLRASNADLESFASILSHDLREPLRTAINYLNLVRQNESQPVADVRSYVGNSLSVMLRMRKLIEGLLELSRIEPKPVSFEGVSFDHVLDVVIADVRALIEESGAILSRGPLPVVKGDPVQLAQLLQNLVVNAIKYRREAPPRIEISAEKSGSSWIFSVRDNGQGFDMKSADRIFQPFYRMKPCEKDENLGIGLSVCEKIAQRHGGRMWAESTPGEGSTFYFSLPG